MEVLIVIAVVGLILGMAFLGIRSLRSARLRESATLVAAAVRVAYNHANATSRPTRLVFDFDTRSVALEEGSGRMLLRQDERTGGAAAATDAEQLAIAEAESIFEEVMEGPREARPRFEPVRVSWFDSAWKRDQAPDTEADPVRKALASGVYFRQIEVAHETEPVLSERAYLYFWPGGQTERAAIQLQLGAPQEETDEVDVMTLTVSPLTGKVTVHRGPAEMERPRTDEEASEREDSTW